MSNNDFPLTALPEKMRNFVNSAALSIGCDPAFVAVPALVTAAAAIGASSALSVKCGWMEPSILWACIVAPSGTGKSPAMEAAIGPLMSHHKAAAKSQGADLNSPRRRYIIRDCTLESIAKILNENPQGTLLAPDELSGWLGGFDKYHAGKGSDVGSWLSLHTGAAIIVDRKKSESVFVDSPCMSLTGTIQPAVLEKCIANHVANGLAARMLLCQPMIRERRWTDSELSTDQTDNWAAIINRLCELHDFGRATFRFGESAKVLYQSWFDSHNAESAAHSDSLRSLWSKLEAACARMSLVIHLLDWACNEEDRPNEFLQRESVRRAVKIVEFFKDEAQLIYANWDSSPLARELQATLECVHLMGGSCTEREFSRKKHITAAEANKALQQLVVDELAVWKPVPAGPQGGRVTRRLYLQGQVTQP